MTTRILIIEDDTDIADLVKRYLERAGFQVDRAATGREGLDRIAEKLPDLIVLDLMLPQVDGLEICRLLRDKQKTAMVPIIMLTARADDRSGSSASRSARTIIAKPFSPNELGRASRRCSAAHNASSRQSAPWRAVRSWSISSGTRCRRTATR
jgi:DNA-binding response OmpR family regulator